MKKIYFRILAICLSLVLTFSILYKDSIQVDALEWVGVAVGYDTAFKFLLGLLGVSVGVGVAQEVDWGTLRQNAIQVQLDQGNSQAEVSAWWSNVIHGSLDTASDCWASFKDWVQDQFSSSSGGVVTGSVSSFLSAKYPNYDTSRLSSDALNYNFNSIILLETNNGAPTYYFFNSAFSPNFTTNYQLYMSASSANKYYYVSLWNTNTANPYFTYYEFNRNEQEFLFSSSSYLSIGFFNILYPTGVSKYYDLDFSPGITDTPLEALYPNIGDIALNPENADTLSTDVIPLPWENIGASDTAIEDVIDDAISKVNDGTMSLENYWEYVQNITNTYAYSIENNYLLPNENGEDKKADDKVKENAENGAFVLYGLEKVFPFCIPFDIYAFITLLKADPVAPVIEYPIYNPVTQENEIITIDFSEWESVVVIFRYIFDFLLIIGLLLLARPLVGAGGDS